MKKKKIQSRIEIDRIMKKAKSSIRPLPSQIKKLIQEFQFKSIFYGVDNLYTQDN